MSGSGSTILTGMEQKPKTDLALIEKELKSDLAIYTVASEGYLEKFLTHLLWNTQQRIYNSLDPAERRLQEKKMAAIHEVSAFMLYRSTKPIDDLDNIWNHEEHAAKVMSLWMRYEKHIASEFNLASVKQAPDPEFYGVRVDLLCDLLHEVHTWVREWVTENRLDRLIKLGQELEKFSPRIDAHRKEEREFFVLLYWEYFIKRFEQEKPDADRGLSASKKKKKLHFFEFLWHQLDALGFDVPCDKKSRFRVPNYGSLQIWCAELGLFRTKPCPISPWLF